MSMPVTTHSTRLENPKMTHAGKCKQGIFSFSRGSCQVNCMTIGLEDYVFESTNDNEIGSFQFGNADLKPGRRGLPSGSSAAYI